MRSLLPLAIVAVVAVVSCKKLGRDTDDKATPAATPNIPPKPPEHPNVTPEALERKGRSEARLKTEGVKINATLPVIDTEAEAKIRTKDAIVERTIALMITAVKGEGLEQEYVDRDRKRFGADAFFSPEEKKFVADLHPSSADKAKFGWRYECLGVMLWALGFHPELEKPDKIVDAGRLVKLVMDKGPTKLREEAKVRSAKELLDEADLIYRYDWACVDARMNGKKAAGGIDCEIVVERHRALNWLVGYQGQAWDDVSTDT